MQPDRCELLRTLKDVTPGDPSKGEADRPLGALDLRPVCHRQVDRGRQRAIRVAD